MNKHMGGDEEGKKAFLRQANEIMSEIEHNQYRLANLERKLAYQKVAGAGDNHANFKREHGKLQ